MKPSKPPSRAHDQRPEMKFCERPPVDEYYAQDLQRCPPLKREDEITLQHCIREGGEDAKRAIQTLIEHNLRLVVAISLHRHREADSDDTNQIGSMELIEKVREGSFDPTRGKFSTFISPWLSQAMRLANEEEYANKTLTTPRAANLATRWERMEKQNPTFTEKDIMRTLGFEPENIISCAHARNAKFRTPKMRHGADHLYFDIRPEDEAMVHDIQAHVQQAITSLTEQEQLVIRGVLFDERPERELAQELGVSRSFVGQIKHRALGKLRVLLAPFDPANDGHPRVKECDDPVGPEVKPSMMRWILTDAIEKKMDELLHRKNASQPYLHSREELLFFITSSLDTLSEDEQRIVRELYFPKYEHEEQTPEMIGKKMGLAKYQVHYRNARIVQKLSQLIVDALYAEETPFGTAG